MSLYLKYRPTTLNEIVGNEAIVQTLDRMLVDNLDIPHAILFTGPTGCGKTTLARIVANAVDARKTDLIEVDSADFRGIDTIRSIIKQSKYKPMYGPSRVWIIDECHKMTNDAQNAMLKILEDTPKHVYFILCTTEPQKLIATIRNRCMTFEVNPLDSREMLRLLRRVVNAEQISLDVSVYHQIVNASNGSPRNALQILEQVMHMSEDEQEQAVQLSAKQESESIELCRALIKRRPWKEISEILRGLKDQDAEGIRRHVLAYCQSVLLNKDEMQAGLIMEMFIDPFYNTGFPALVFACYQIAKS